MIIEQHRQRQYELEDKKNLESQKLENTLQQIFNESNERENIIDNRE